MRKKKKKQKQNALQDLLGIKTFTRYGLETEQGELVFFQISPTNVAVLSQANIALKVKHMMLLLSTFPDMEVCCTDAAECFDEILLYLRERREKEPNAAIRRVLEADANWLDQEQTEMSKARQFMLVFRLGKMKDEQKFQLINRIAKITAEQGFEAHRMSKEEIKRCIAIYFNASLFGGQLPDMDGEQYLKEEIHALQKT